MDYYLTGGDAETPQRHLKVLPAPTVTSVAIDLAFPRYTKVLPRTNVEGGTVEAIVGTTVTVHARTNMPAQIATVNLNMASEAPAPMDISSSDPTVLTGKFNVKENGSYTIQFRTSGAQSNPSPVNYDIIAIPDRAPTAKFLQPERPDWKVPANIKLDLVMTGSDDHGVKDATLLVKVGNNVLRSKNVLEGQPVQPEFRATETLDLPQLGIKPGSTLTYKMTVRDNKEPSSNKTETEWRVIDVVEPVTPDEKQAIEEEQKRPREHQNPAAGADPEPQTPAEESAPEQIAKPQPEGGPGRELDAKTGEQTAGELSANVPGPTASTRIASKSVRNQGTAAQDQMRESLEGSQFEPPPEWRVRWAKYQTKLAKVVASQRGSAPARRPKP